MHEQAFRILTLLLLVVLCSERAHAQVRHVDVDAPPGGDGSSWVQAMNNLSAALNTSSASIAEIWVAEGRYGAPTTGFVLPSDVRVYGGFAGTETSKNQRDPALHPTVLDGDALGDDQPDWSGYDDNALRVVRDSGGTRSHLDGFTVRGGRGSPGAGLFLEAREAILANLLVRENRTFVGIFSGGGAELHCERVDVRDCVFQDNRATAGAGLVMRDPQHATVANCSFQRNQATAGGGIYIVHGGPATHDDLFVESCTFADNRACGGGGIYTNSGPILVSHCTFRNNNLLLPDPLGCGAGTGGGAIRAGIVTTDGLVYLFNSSFSGSEHGLVRAEAASIVAEQCSFSNVGVAQPTFRLTGAILDLKSSVVWGDAGDQILNVFRSVVTASHSNVRRGGTVLPGVGNIEADPLFVDALAGDLRLRPGSPCIDAGDPSVRLPGADLGGNSRTTDGNLDRIQRIDLGAYEASPVELAITGTPIVGGTLTVTTTGRPGLVTALRIGRPAELFFPRWGTLFGDNPVVFQGRWPGAPSTVDVVVPPGFSGSYHVQEIVLAPNGAMAFSNYVPLEF